MACGFQGSNSLGGAGNSLSTVLNFPSAVPRSHRRVRLPISGLTMSINGMEGKTPGARMVEKRQFSLRAGNFAARPVATKPSGDRSFTH